VQLALHAYMTDWNKTARLKRFINYSIPTAAIILYTYAYARETVRTPRYRDRDHKIMTYTLYVWVVCMYIYNNDNNTVITYTLVCGFRSGESLQRARDAVCMGVPPRRNEFETRRRWAEEKLNSYTRA
jgi:hypothetical protein